MLNSLQFATAYENAKDRHLELSIEALPERDADILFIGLADENPSTNLNALAVLKQPIWSSLKAAQNQHLHVVNWAGIAGLSTAQRFIDELEKYFVDS
jgi:iron complex transport system substrate-binding protein